MGKSKRRKQKSQTDAPIPSVVAPDRPSRNTAKIGIAVSLVAAALAGWYFYPAHAARVNTRNPTFAQDVAPLIYTQCATCHHAGGSAPFALISFADVSKRAPQIAQITASRTMPPWMPEHGYGNFDGERRLTDEQIAMLKNWAAQGAPPGDLAHAPTPPNFDADWTLGKPDLVVQMPRPYTLPAEGRDVYRNFDVPVPLKQDTYIKGMEFRAGTTRIHHAFIKTDRTPAARRRDAQEAQPGWDGMEMLLPSVETPTAQFTSWQPGKIARMHEDLAWKLNAGTDLVLQLHMQPSGKPETIQPSVGLYFTDHPGSVHPEIMMLRSLDMDIPAGEKDYKVHVDHTLTADIDVLAILPHVHYLGKDLKAFATLPNGDREWLLWIKDWNFIWQGDYSFKRPVFLPKGSRIDMDYTFDNSAENPLNPSHPPQRVRYGTQSTDEMAELWLQILPHTDSDAPALHQDLDASRKADFFALNNHKLRVNPSDALAHLELGKAFIMQDQLPQAEAHLRSAIQFNSASSAAHYFLGYLLNKRITDQRSLNECLTEYSQAVRLDPENYEALNALGFTLFQFGSPQKAEPYLIEGLRLQPNDPILRSNLEQVQKALGKVK